MRSLLPTKCELCTHGESAGSLDSPPVSHHPTVTPRACMRSASRRPTHCGGHEHISAAFGFEEIRPLDPVSSRDGRICAAGFGASGWPKFIRGVHLG